MNEGLVIWIALHLVFPLISWETLRVYFWLTVKLSGCKPTSPECKALNRIWGHRLGWLAFLSSFTAIHIATTHRDWQAIDTLRQYFAAGRILEYVSIGLLIYYLYLISLVGSKTSAAKTENPQPAKKLEWLINLLGSVTYIMSVGILLGVIYAVAN